jgi:uncharacterized protein
VGHDSDGDDDARGDDEGRSAGLTPFSIFVLFEAALAPVAIFLGWLLNQPPLGGFAWDVDAAGKGALATVPMLGFLAATIYWPVGPLGQIKAFFDHELAPALRGCDWPDLALISVAAGMGEEMLFRGVIQGSLARALGPLPGLAAAAAVFGLLHPISLTYVAIAGLLGAYLGAVWLVSGNLLTVMVAHALYDFIALIVLLKDRPGDEDAAKD